MAVKKNIKKIHLKNKFINRKQNQTKSLKKKWLKVVSVKRPKILLLEKGRPRVAWLEKKRPKTRKTQRKIYLKIKPNIFFHSFWFVKFVNKLMQRGRKASVEKIVFRVFKKLKVDLHKNALKILFFALVKNRPILGFYPIKIRGDVKQVPFALRPKRQLVISLTWFLIALKLLRYSSKTITIETLLYTQLKATFQKEKTILTNRRIKHLKELTENRINLKYRRKIKK